MTTAQDPTKETPAADTSSAAQGAAVQAKPVEQQATQDKAVASPTEAPAVDVNKTLADFDKRLEKLVKDALQQEVGPIKAQLQRREELHRTGFTEEQFSVWSEFKGKGLTDTQAMVLARQAKPELFAAPAQKFDPSVVGQLAPGGENPDRFGTGEKNWDAEMKARIIAQRTAADPVQRAVLGERVQEAAFESFAQKIGRVYARG